MLKIVFSLLILGIVVAKPTDDFDQKLFNFFSHFDKFYRQYNGCPLDTLNPADCRAAKSFMNYREYEESRKSAAKLFNLQEK